LDLPYLTPERFPRHRTEAKVEFRVTKRLGSPLNRCSESFSEQGFVPELNAYLLAPSKSVAYLGLAQGRVDLLGRVTTMVVLRDGQRWHFDAGTLVAVQSDAFTIVYRRDAAGRILTMEGHVGAQKRAEIRLNPAPRRNLRTAWPGSFGRGSADGSRCTHSIRVRCLPVRALLFGRVQFKVPKSMLEMLKWVGSGCPPSGLLLKSTSAMIAAVRSMMFTFVTGALSVGSERG
jgi:hypothetical protein